MCLLFKKLAKLEIFFFFEFEFENEGFSVHFATKSKRRKIDPNPEWASIIHTSAYITALMTSYVVLFKAEYKLSSAAHIQTNSGVKLSFPLNVFKKTSTHWMQLRPQRPRMKHTLKPAWIILIIVIIMPQSVGSQVWQIPQTWGRNWALGHPEMSWIWNIQHKIKRKEKKKTEGNVCFLSADGIASYVKLTTNCSPVEKLFCMIGKRLHSNPLPPKNRAG